jgi:hypothetical protein
MRSAGPIQNVFACLLTLQFLVVVLHDWLDIPGWTHGAQVQLTVGRRKLLIATVINAIFPALAVAGALFYWNRPMPLLVANYGVLYCAVTVLSAIAMWHIPYFFGAAETTRRQYEQMYAGTIHLLPPRNGNPRPNLLHLCLHALFAINVCLSFMVRLRSSE